MTTLPVTLFNDYRKFVTNKKKKGIKGWTVKKTKEETLAELRHLASNKLGWRELVTEICDDLDGSLQYRFARTTLRMMMMILSNTVTKNKSEQLSLLDRSSSIDSRI